MALNLHEQVSAAARQVPLVTLTLGYLRYEALRKLHPRQFAMLHSRNLQGERFDDMVDDLVLGVGLRTRQKKKDHL